MSPLVQAIEHRAAEMSDRVIRDMYQDPFWQDRFGQRGRTHADQDSRYHLQFLVQALASSDAVIFERYARWLQSLLTSRGMCTHHIAETFQRLEKELEAAIPDCALALDYLRQGRRALEYSQAEAHELQKAQERLASAVEASGASEARHWLSYLADAMALDKPELFHDYLRWRQDFDQRRGAGVEHTAHLHQTLRQALDNDAQLSSALKTRVRRILEGTVP